jgi:hypothetical protein
MTRADHLTRFKSVRSEPLAARPISVKLPVDIDAVIRALPEPSEWLRRVICEAVKKELSSNSESEC